LSPKCEYSTWTAPSAGNMAASLQEESGTSRVPCLLRLLGLDTTLTTRRGGRDLSISLVLPCSSFWTKSASSSGVDTTLSEGLSIETQSGHVCVPVSIRVGTSPQKRSSRERMMQGLHRQDTDCLMDWPKVLGPGGPGKDESQVSLGNLVFPQQWGYPSVPRSFDPNLK
jgi:hypothetical protein